uniref:Transposase n=1 Tax=[Saintpaulia] hybrid cultivar TaxID=911500 RepID=E3WH24_9LAMI|nr:transposase [[Saintpaulia] hybrid cultivar]
MNSSSGSGSLPSTTQSQTLSSSTTSALIDEVLEVGVKRKKVAEVWSHAKKIVKRNDKNEVTAIVAVCNYCQTEVPAHSKTHGNNGIDGHVKKCKKNPHNKVSSSSSQSILAQSSMNNALTPHIFSQKKLEDKVVAFVVKDEMPFRVVEGAGFLEMMKEAQPRFKIPNRKKIASLICDLYAMEVAKIKSVIGDQRISITTDTWTSIQNINYMVITAHFLDNDWKLHKRILNFTKITSHKGDDIGKVLETCLSDWGIDKVFTITVDNASTNDKAVEYMRKRLKEMGTLLLDGKYLHLRCCCHIINLIVKSGLKFLNEAVESIRNCVKYIHSSAARLDQFRECAILLKMDKMSTVPMDVPTRWNSTYTMLSVAYKFKKVFGRMTESIQFVEYFEEVDGSEKKKRVGPPMEKDWEKAQVFVNFLKRFYDTTLQLSASKKTTSPLIWEEIVSLGTIINDTIVNTLDPSLQEVSKKMETKFKKYWGDLENVNKLIFLGHILDPRYKLQMIGIHLGDMKLDSTKIHFFVDGLKKSLMELYHAYKGNSLLDSLEGVDDGDVDKELMEMYKNDHVKLNFHMKMAQVRKSQNQAEITNEVDKYFSDPFVKWSSNFDILEWWKGNTTTYPVISKIARDIFAIPSSTVASENAFSLGRRVVDPFRASLHPKMVEALVCTSDWLRDEEINLYKDPTEEEFNFYKDCEEVVTGKSILSINLFNNFYEDYDFLTIYFYLSKDKLTLLFVGTLMHITK